MNDVDSILSAIEQGDTQAAEQLLPLVYDELRRLAVRRLAREKPGQTLQATALVHEVFLRLVNSGRGWGSRVHFFAAAAEAMRLILINRARDKSRMKNGGGLRRVSLDRVDLEYDTDGLDLLALDEAMTRLAAEEPECAQLVKLRFFTGLTQDEAAEVLGVSRRTADRYWAYARAWLLHAIEGSDGGG